MRRLLVLASLIGCGTDAVDEPLPPDPIPHQTTWYQNVGPIVATKCMGCHHDGGIAPFSLETYEDAATYGMQMLAAVDSGQMPPWSATTATDCAPTRPWKHDPRLTATELDTLHAWIEDDRPAGDFAELSPAAEQHLAGATHSLVPAPFVTSGDADQFMCFVLDPELVDLTFMTGWEVVPGNPSVVHHAVVMTMDPAALQAVKDAGALGTAVSCDQAPANQIIGAWAPGQGPVEMPEGVASVLTPGTGVVVQIHYHPAGNLNEPDATAIKLRLTTDRPTQLYAFGGWGNAHGAPQLQPDPDDVDGLVKFLIPAGNPNHTETMIFNIADTAPRTKMFIMQPHQHYIGTRLELRIHRADPQNEPVDECLVNSDWNFDWQRTYQYDVPIDELPTFGPGDQITVRCTYNNTLANPFVQRALAEQHLEAPIDVHLGEQTLDEMCLGLTGLIVDAPQ